MTKVIKYQRHSTFPAVQLSFNKSLRCMHMGSPSSAARGAPWTAHTNTLYFQPPSNTTVNTSTLCAVTLHCLQTPVSCKIINNDTKWSHAGLVQFLVLQQSLLRVGVTPRIMHFSTFPISSFLTDETFISPAQTKCETSWQDILLKTEQYDYNI